MDHAESLGVHSAARDLLFTLLGRMLYDPRASTAVVSHVLPLEFVFMVHFYGFSDLVFMIHFVGCGRCSMTRSTRISMAVGWSLKAAITEVFIFVLFLTFWSGWTDTT